MLTIRLTRTGKKHAPSYRIIVKEKRDKRDGKYTDLLGFYNPSHNPVLFELDQDKFKAWQAKGAQVSEGLAKLITIQSGQTVKPKPKRANAKK